MYSWLWSCLPRQDGENKIRLFASGCCIKWIYAFVVHTPPSTPYGPPGKGSVQQWSTRLSQLLITLMPHGCVWHQYQLRSWHRGVTKSGCQIRVVLYRHVSESVRLTVGKQTLFFFSLLYVCRVHYCPVRLTDCRNGRSQKASPGRGELRGGGVKLIYTRGHNRMVAL